jgi:hypothetical protein
MEIDPVEIEKRVVPYRYNSLYESFVSTRGEFEESSFLFLVESHSDVNIRELTV